MKHADYRPTAQYLAEKLPADHPFRQARNIVDGEPAWDYLILDVHRPETARYLAEHLPADHPFRQAQSTTPPIRRIHIDPERNEWYASTADGKQHRFQFRDPQYVFDKPNEGFDLTALGNGITLSNKGRFDEGTEITYSGEEPPFELIRTVASYATTGSLSLLLGARPARASEIPTKWRSKTQMRPAARPATGVGRTYHRRLA